MQVKVCLEVTNCIFLLPLSITVCLIITVVKSSLALSLGLVGALSIVRFRTPIKDPEDLVYLFWLLFGLGLGLIEIYIRLLEYLQYLSF